MPRRNLAELERAIAMMIDVVEESDDEEAPLSTVVEHEFIAEATEKAQLLLPEGHLLVLKLWLLR